MTEPDDTDVKALLGRALAGEPPLRLDGAEVIREGRRRVRRRRLFSAGGAIAGVVAAAVGAVMLTGLLADESRDEAPPAASPTARPAPPSGTTSSSAERLRALTGVLFDSGLLDTHLQLTAPGGRPAVFAAAGGGYALQADVISPSPSREGALSVTVAKAAPAAVSCAAVHANAGCEVRTVHGVRVAVGTWKDHGTGEKRYVAYTIRADGTSVTAMATNLSDRKRVKGVPPADRVPVVDDGTLAKIVALPGLRFPG